MKEQDSQTPKASRSGAAAEGSQSPGPMDASPEAEKKVGAASATPTPPAGPMGPTHPVAEGRQSPGLAGAVTIPRWAADLAVAAINLTQDPSATMVKARGVIGAALAANPVSRGVEGRELESVRKLWLEWRENGMANAVTKAGEYLWRIGKVVEPDYPADRLGSPLAATPVSREPAPPEGWVKEVRIFMSQPEWERYCADGSLPNRGKSAPSAAGPAVQGVDLEDIAPNLVELARGELHDDDCPQDDTCRCENIRTLNAECKALQQALRRSRTPSQGGA